MDISKIIILLFAIGFGFWGYKRSLYPSWSLLFNILISVYIAVMTAPQLVSRIGFFKSYFGKYDTAVVSLFSAIIVFAAMQLLSYKFFTSVYYVSIPKYADLIGSAVLGFFSGIVIASFLLFLLNICPLSKNALVSDMHKPESVVRSSCDFVHSISLQADPASVVKQFDRIFPHRLEVKSSSATAGSDSNVVSEPNNF